MTYAIRYGSFGTGILKGNSRDFEKYGNGNHKYHNHKHQKDSQPPPQSSDSLTYLGEGVAKQDEVSYEVSQGEDG